MFRIAVIFNIHEGTYTYLSLKLSKLIQHGLSLKIWEQNIDEKLLSSYDLHH